MVDMRDIDILISHATRILLFAAGMFTLATAFIVLKALLKPMTKCTNIYACGFFYKNYKIERHLERILLFVYVPERCPQPWPIIVQSL